MLVGCSILRARARGRGARPTGSALPFLWLPVWSAVAPLARHRTGRVRSVPTPPSAPGRRVLAGIRQVRRVPGQTQILLPDLDRSEWPRSLDLRVDEECDATGGDPDEREVDRDPLGIALSPRRDVRGDPQDE